MASSLRPSGPCSSAALTPPTTIPIPSPPSSLCLRFATSPASSFSCSRHERINVWFGQIPAPEVLRARSTKTKCSKFVVFSAVVRSLDADGDARRGPGEECKADVELMSRSTLLWRAAKLPIYSVALVPLSVGSAAAYLEKGLFSSGQFLLLWLSSFLIIAWLNLSNDAYDAETGVDKDKQESVVNIIGNQKSVFVAAYTCLVIGISGLSWGVFQTGDVRIAVLLFAAISCGYIYQCPPFRLGYKGLGEPLCFLAFGPFATTAFYLSQANVRKFGILQFPRSIIAAAVIVGVTTTLVLFCSHFHQIEGDLSIGKISPLVRIGTENGARVVELIVNGLYFLLAMLSVFKVLPMYTTILCFLTYPVGKLVKDYVKANHSNKQAIFMAKYYCVRLHIAIGIALVLGFLAAAKLPPLSFW